MLANTTKLTGPSDKGLTVNIIRFSRRLRESGISVALNSVLDAIRSIEIIDISNLNVFRGLLRLNFIRRKEDIDLFDQLFFLFWFSKQQTGLQVHYESSGDEEPEAQSPSEKKAPIDSHRDEDKLNESAREWVACYSPDASNRTCELDDLTESRVLYESIKKLLQPLRNRLSRRMQYSIRGNEINLRQMLRKNMQFGGELIRLDYKRNYIRKKG